MNRNLSLKSDKTALIQVHVKDRRQDLDLIT